MASINELVELLQRANYAYHNGGEAILGDDEYDLKLDELRRLSPAHPFLSLIGAPPAKGSVLLPITMGSLDKMRYGEGILARWVRRMISPVMRRFVVTEKLDGLSCLYVSDGKGGKRLFLRGDGVKGVDVSRAAPVLSLPPIPCMIRGEILLPNAATPAGSIGRSLVNGWLHRLLDGKAAIPKELAECHFVGYQVIEPAGLTRSEQMEWMNKRGFKIPRCAVLEADKVTDEKAKEILIKWKGESKYPLDGIVLGADQIPVSVGGGEARNPPDAAAFKAALDEQREETTVTAVEWNLSRQDYWIPTIIIEPVQIGGATISRLSGHNAKMILENGIGPGARVVIRRSGDVIPTLDEVLEAAPNGPSVPCGKDASAAGEEDCPWEWDDTHTHARRKEGAEEGGAEAAAKGILHGLQTLGVEGVGPGLVTKMVEEGLGTMKAVWEAPDAVLGKAIGAGRGPVFKANLRKAVGAASQMSMLIASNCLPRGVGDKKLRLLYAVEPDAHKWTKAMFTGAKQPAGWSSESLDTLFNILPKAFKWINESFPGASAVPVPAPVTVSAPASAAGPIKGVVFTNVRDKVLESIMESKGWKMEDSVTRKTMAVVVPDGGTESGKTKKAKEYGIQILELSEFRTMLK